MGKGPHQTCIRRGQSGDMGGFWEIKVLFRIRIWYFFLTLMLF